MSKHGTLAAILVLLTMLPGMAAAASIGRCGSGGGSQTASLSCPPGQYVVALSAKGGDYLDRLGIKCAPFNASGVRGSMAHTAGAGGSGGTESASSTCSGNRAIGYILTYSGSWVDALTSALCAQRKAAGGFDEVKFESRLEFNVGGKHGRQCSLTCPAGQAIHKITVRYGAWIDSIEAFCQP